MASDPFAAIRKVDTGASTSFLTEALVHPKHPSSDGVLHENPQKTEGKHPQHQKHRERQHTDEARQHEPSHWDDPHSPQPSRPALIVPAFRHADYELVPPRWRAGLRNMNETACPAWFEPSWWTTYVTDALVFAIGWGNDAVASGWSIGSLFGGDADLGVVSLIADLRGDRVVSLWRDDADRHFADIKTADGWRCHRRLMPDHAPLLWKVDPRTSMENAA